MRERPSTRRPVRRTDDYSPFQVSRTFAPAAIDLDDLAEAVRRLLGSGDDAGAEPPLASHLLLKRRRVSHVMGAEGVPAN